MKIAIMGAGALGGTFGFLLQEAGYDVTMIDVDRQKVDAVRADGLTLIMPDGERRTLPLEITSDPREVGPVDLVQISVKGYDTSTAAEMAVPMVADHTYVLSVQNGLNNLPRIAAFVGDEKVIGGVTAHSAMALGPALIKYNGGVGGVSIGRYDGTEDPGLQTFVEMLDACRLEGHLIHGDIQVPLWRKLLANVSTNPIAALTGFTGRELIEFPPTNRLIRAMAAETAEAARAQGFNFAELEEPAEFVLKALSGVGDNKISMLQDIEAGRRTEIETLNLAVTERAEAAGVDAPLNWAIGQLVLAKEKQVSEGS